MSEDNSGIGRNEKPSASNRLVVRMIETVISLISGLVVAGLGAYLPLTNLFIIALFILLLILAVCLLVSFEYIATRRLEFASMKRNMMLAWGEFLYMLGWFITIAIIAYSVWSRWYEKVDLFSLSCWMLGYGWFLMICLPAGAATLYRNKLRVLADWPQWRHKIIRYLGNRDEVSQEEVKQLMGDADELEVKEVMKLFAREMNMILKKGYDDMYTLKKI